MDLSKVRQHARLASGGSLESAPSKTDIDAKAAGKPTGSQHIWRGNEGDGSSSSHPDYGKPASPPTKA